MLPMSSSGKSNRLLTGQEQNYRATQIDDDVGETILDGTE